MSGKANTSKKKSQRVKRNVKQRADKEDEELDSPENKVGNRAKRNRSHAGHLSSKEQTKCVHLKRVKISSNKRTAWQPLPKNTEEYLQSMMDSAILGILNKNIKRKEQIQYHLDQLKKRFLQQCATLKVPPGKLNYLRDMSKLLKVEREQERANEESLASLQEEIDKIVETTESMTENIESLKTKIEILTNEVEKEEEEMKETFHIFHYKMLKLIVLSYPQKEILTLIPNQNALLKDLDVLQNSAPGKNMAAFIQEAYMKLNGS
uniref:Centromere protein Q n=1 Tax=Rattus norvegicus TaxID=10116 RepID=A0A0G2K3W4_RAT